MSAAFNVSDVRRVRLGAYLMGAGILAAAAADFLSPAALEQSVAHTWAPFALITGLLPIGVVANRDGVFETLAAPLDRAPSGLPLYLLSMLLVTAVTVLLNLDTSVAFLTPVLLHVARRRDMRDTRLLYGCVFTSNTASLLLPGSNLTNLLILAHEHVSGWQFLASMFFLHQNEPGRTTAVKLAGRPGLLSVLGITVAAALILLLADSPLPVRLGMEKLRNALAEPGGPEWASR